MATEFSPRDYQSYEALPPDYQIFYKPVPDGFAPESVVDDVATAYKAASIQNNRLTLQEITREKTLDLMGMLAAIGEDDTLRVLSDPTGQVAKRREEWRTSLDTLPERSELVNALIIINGITEPIDREFVDAVIELYDVADKQMEYVDPQDRRLENFVTELRARNTARELARSQEKRVAVTLSGDRQVTVVTDAAAEKLSLELPVITEPSLVRLGPKAVEQILGGRLTDEDYAGLASVLLAIEGPIGDALREYEVASERWATAKETGGDVQAAALNRSKAADTINVACLRTREDFWLYNSIVLYSIMTTVVRRHPGIMDFETPQPYSG